jgi:hypothetical protein
MLLFGITMGPKHVSHLDRNNDVSQEAYLAPSAFCFRDAYYVTADNLYIVAISAESSASSRVSACSRVRHVHAVLLLAKTID